jgi:hypothetical protein
VRLRDAGVYVCSAVGHVGVSGAVKEAELVVKSRNRRHTDAKAKKKRKRRKQKKKKKKAKRKEEKME